MVIQERKQNKQLTATQIETYKKAGENVWEFIKTLPLAERGEFIAKFFSAQELLAGLSLEERLVGLSKSELDKMADLIEKLRAEK